jgi:tRNA1(Val) A37 N6-methylase TrmN6
MTASISKISEDALLDGRVRLLQPAKGYRVAVDPVLLAAAVAAKPGQRALDLGAGSGAAALCLLARCAGVRVLGLELDPDMAALARRSAALNGVEERFQIDTGDAARPAKGERDAFDHVLMNPPYLEQGRDDAPPGAGRTQAHMEGEAGLQDWIKGALARLKDQGWLTLIHRADRLDAILAALHGRFGSVEIIPLWPKAGRPASRVIVRARKGAKGRASLLPGLVLHREDGAYTEAAEAILRHAKAL